MPQRNEHLAQKKDSTTYLGYQTATTAKYFEATTRSQMLKMLFTIAQKCTYPTCSIELQF